VHDFPKNTTKILEQLAYFPVILLCKIIITENSRNTQDFTILLHYKGHVQLSRLYYIITLQRSCTVVFFHKLVSN
jgi:hypothetical protein